MWSGLISEVKPSPPEGFGSAREVPNDVIVALLLTTATDPNHLDRQ